MKKKVIQITFFLLSCVVSQLICLVQRLSMSSQIVLGLIHRLTIQGILLTHVHVYLEQTKKIVRITTAIILQHVIGMLNNTIIARLISQTLIMFTMITRVPSLALGHSVLDVVRNGLRAVVASIIHGSKELLSDLTILYFVSFSEDFNSF